MPIIQLYMPGRFAVIGIGFYESILDIVGGWGGAKFMETNLKGLFYYSGCVKETKPQKMCSFTTDRKFLLNWLKILAKNSYWT